MGKVAEWLEKARQDLKATRIFPLARPGEMAQGGMVQNFALAVLCACLVLGSCSDPMSGLRFACDPDGPNTCASGFVCVRAEAGHSYKGVCVECELACLVKQCGPDGCGGSCGTCPGPQDECIEGQCVCQPACQGKQCGSDGCGGSCGECPAGTSCESGTCRPTCWTGTCPGGYQKYDGCRCRVAPTGVTQCKVPGQTDLVACSTITPGQPGYGQDGHFQSGSLSYANNGDGSVVDNLTGLVWSEAPDAPSVDWNTASTTTCSSKGSGWRLPTVVELLSLVDYSKPGCLQQSDPQQPMWDAVFGKLCPSESRFWAAVPWSSSSVFLVHFDLGNVYYDDVGRNFGVRCVRAGQENPTDEPRFVDLGETVFDRLTGLEWEKVPLYSSGRTWAQALSGCLNSKKAGGGWRLPNVKELYSLVEIRGSGCQRNEVFQGVCGWYWTSTPVPWSSSSAFYVFFGNGCVYDLDVGNNIGVRCVRAGQK